MRSSANQQPTQPAPVLPKPWRRRTAGGFREGLAFDDGRGRRLSHAVCKLQNALDRVLWSYTVGSHEAKNGEAHRKTNTTGRQSLDSCFLFLCGGWHVRFGGRQNCMAGPVRGISSTAELCGVSLIATPRSNPPRQ